MTEQLNRITVHGTPVVPGIAYGPAIWPSSRPELVTDAPALDEADREADADAFVAAAKAVENRLLGRAAEATAAAAEVLQANADQAAYRCGIRGHTNMIARGLTPPQHS